MAAGRTRVGAAALAALAALTLSAVPAGPAEAAAPPTVVPLSITVDGLGPAADVRCTIVGDLYLPPAANAAHPVPAVLTTNGFGGSKDDGAELATSLAGEGYATLTYSGLGFGGSSCPITLDQPAFDGRAASRLVQLLGGRPGLAVRRDTGVPYTVDAVARDPGLPHDPRVGMIGGSYGGQVQFAAASEDPRLDTIIPVITWHDLSYSLAPNNAALPAGGVSGSEPGVTKYQWTALFFALGVARGLEHLAVDAQRLATTGCLNFDRPACPAAAQLLSQGYPGPRTVDYARGASVTSYLDRVRIPTMLMQGQADTLFTLEESVATYRALRQRDVPVRLVWQSWGRSQDEPAPGEYDEQDLRGTHQGRLVLQWFDHYLRGRGAQPPLDFSYYRDWIGYDGIASPAYASAPGRPVGTERSFQLSGDGRLVERPADVRAGALSWANTAGRAPLSYTETSAVDQQLPVTDAPGGTARWEGAPLAEPVTIVGAPRLRVRLDSPAAAAGQSGGPAGRLVLFAKLYDVAPNGAVTLVHRVISPVRVPDVTRPVEMRLPAIVHRVPPGHRLALALSGTDAAYVNQALVQPVSVRVAAGSPEHALRVPVVAAETPATVPELADE